MRWIKKEKEELFALRWKLADAHATDLLTVKMKWEDDWQLWLVEPKFECRRWLREIEYAAAASGERVSIFDNKWAFRDSSRLPHFIFGPSSSKSRAVSFQSNLKQSSKPAINLIKANFIFCPKTSSTSTSSSSQSRVPPSLSGSNDGCKIQLKRARVNISKQFKGNHMRYELLAKQYVELIFIGRRGFSISNQLPQLYEKFHLKLTPSLM